jgi:hypothetical protein
LIVRGACGLFLRSIALVALLHLSSCGGGGGGASIEPLWVSTDVMVAEFDGDGRADVLALATVSEGGRWEGRLLVYRQTARGVFAPPVATLVGTYPWRLALGDVNGDSKSDIVAGDSDSATWLLLQDVSRPGQLLAPQALLSGSGYPVIADLNGDGLLDVAVTRYPIAESGVVIRYQIPEKAGTFGPPVTVTLPGQPGDLVAGDIDRDGRIDLLVWIETDRGDGRAPIRGALVAMFQQAGGGFEISAGLAPQIGMNVDRLAIADANGDGRPDLLASLAPSSQDYTAKLVVLPQTAIRGFGTPIHTSLADVQGNLDAVFADLNGDGVVDAAVAGFWPESGGPLAAPNVRSRANVLLNNGSGGFSLAAAMEMPVAVSRLTAGDLDGDGRNDIVVYGDEQCLVMFQSASPGAFLTPHTLP